MLRWFHNTEPWQQQQQQPPQPSQHHNVPHGASLCNSNRPVEIFVPHITETEIGVEPRYETKTPNNLQAG